MPITGCWKSKIVSFFIHAQALNAIRSDSGMMMRSCRILQVEKQDGGRRATGRQPLESPCTVIPEKN